MLELEREREGSPWADARLSSAVLPMHRPGVSAPTHYEVGVEGPDGQPRGFMVLSAGRHDYPVVFSTAHGPRRSTELAHQVSDASRIARVYFLSPVSLVAESATGAMLGNLGGLPPKVEHARAEWLDAPAASRHGHTHYDAHSDTRVSQRPEHEVALGAWASWTELRREYADNYAVLHEALRRGAEDDWAAEDDFRASGEGLQSGWFRELPLLSRGGAHIELSGSGAPFVRTRIDERPFEGDTALRVFVEEVPDGDVHPLELRIRYGDGTAELHRFDLARTIDFSAPPQAVLGSVGQPVASFAPSAAAPPECRKAVLRSPWDTYVYARNGGGSTLHAKGGWIGGWEVFTLHRAGRSHVQLQASNGDWVYASGGGGGTVRADGVNKGGDALFERISRTDGTVAFRTRNRRNYLQANATGDINATPTAARSWESFNLEYCEPSRIEGRWAGSNAIDAYRKVRKYDQLPGKFGPNTSSCSSGCGATVWAMVFGWADHMAKLDRKWVGAANLYRAGGKKSGAPADAPEWMWNDVPGRMRTVGAEDDLLSGPAAMVLEIRRLIGDWGASGCSASMRARGSRLDPGPAVSGLTVSP